MDALITAFSSNGLIGVVVGALFFMLYSQQKESKAMNDATDKRIDDQSNRHNAERQQWLCQLKEFSEVLRSFSAKRCGAFKDKQE